MCYLLCGGWWLSSWMPVGSETSVTGSSIEYLAVGRHFNESPLTPGCPIALRGELRNRSRDFRPPGPGYCCGAQFSSLARSFQLRRAVSTSAQFRLAQRASEASGSPSAHARSVSW